MGNRINTKFRFFTLNFWGESIWYCCKAPRQTDMGEGARKGRKKRGQQFVFFCCCNCFVVGSSGKGPRETSRGK